MDLRYGQDLLIHRARGTTWAVGSSQSQPPAEGVLFSADFEDPNELGSNIYNFGSRYAPGTQWVHTHLPTGGWNGSGGAHITMLAGETQYNIGWHSPTLVPHTFEVGDGIYVRLRIKFDETARNRADENWNNKFIMIGTTGTPNSRLIFQMSPPAESEGCRLADFQAATWTFPDFYGIVASPNNFVTGVAGALDVYDYSWSLNPAVNIGWTCGQPVFLTIPSNPLGGRPGPAGKGATAVNGWNHLQWYVQSGAYTDVVFKTWCNTNDFANPTQSTVGSAIDCTGSCQDLHVTDWTTNINVGGFMAGDLPAEDIGWVMDDFQIALDFDPNWYPA